MDRNRSPKHSYKAEDDDDDDDDDKEAHHQQQQQQLSCIPVHAATVHSFVCALESRQQRTTNNKQSSSSIAPI